MVESAFSAKLGPWSAPLIEVLSIPDEIAASAL